MTSDNINRLPENRRAELLLHLLGISKAEAWDLSLNGRKAVIAKLEAARRLEIARGRAGSWLYDVNRHLNLSRTLRSEREALNVQEALRFKEAAPLADALE